MNILKIKSLEKCNEAILKTASVSYRVFQKMVSFSEQPPKVYSFLFMAKLKQECHKAPLHHSLDYK